MTRNWRNPFGFWGKLAKMVYGRNRLELRAKLMNIWRNNRYNIQSQVQTNFITTSLPISIKFSDLPCEISSDFVSISCPSSPLAENNFRDDAILSNRNDATHEIEQGEIHLTMHEWLRISKFLEIKNKLEPEWTNILNEKMSMKYPFCVLKFLYHRINKNSTNSNKCSFLVAAAICKFSDCFKFKFIMEEPETNANNVFVITYFVTGSISKDHFANQVSQSRHLAGERRETISEQLENRSVSNFHYSLFTKPDIFTAAKHGNFNSLHSTDVLRKVKSQHMSKSRFNNDMWQDIVSTQLSFKSTIIGDKMNGYIQTISHTPFVIHLYSEEQISLLKYLEKKSLTFHLDATGSVVRKLEKSQDRILYYALSVQHPESHVSPIPLAEMISSKQTNVEISHFLKQWLYDVKKVTNSEVTPSQVEVDYNWAMLHSVCNSFNKQTLEDYLATSWQVIHTPKSIKPPKTIIHICSAHIMNRLSYKLSRKFRIDQLRKRKVMFIMARFVSCTALDELKQLFVALCITSLAKKNYPEIEDFFS